jgi:LmbE family N-acetylglucosaminyl deacetylase
MAEPTGDDQGGREAVVPRHDPEASAIILSPHLDDAVWSAFSVLTGTDPVVVVNVCAGVPSPGEPPGWDRACGARERSEHVRRRIAEDRAALGRLGREAVYLPVLDQQYRNGRAAPVGEALAALGERISATSRVYAPGGIDGHPDHVLGRDMGIALADARVPVTFYADYSYNTRHGWPRWVVAEGGTPEAEAQWRAALNGVRGVHLETPRVELLGAASSEAKLASMRDYETQFDAIEREEPNWQLDGKPPSDPAKRVIEVFYDVQ